MIDHPLATTLLIAGYISLIIAFLYLGLVVVPKSQVRSRVARIGGVGLYLMSAFGNLTLMTAVLFAPDKTLGDLVGAWPTVIVSLLSITFVVMFMFGFYNETGRFLEPPNSRRRRHKD